MRKCPRLSFCARGFTMDGMSRRAVILSAIIVLACGSATCLYSGAGPIDPAMRGVGGSWHPTLQAIADLLTVPLPTAGVADVRDVVLVFFLGAALAAAAGISFFGGATPSIPVSDLFPERTTLLSPVRWLLCCGGAALALGIVSAITSRSPEYSWGWLVRFAAGIGWAALIGAYLPKSALRGAIVWLLGVGGLAIVLGFAHSNDRGYARMSWPIGPITLTAALAACWATMGLILGIGSLRQVMRGDAAHARAKAFCVGLLSVAGAAAAIAAMVNTGRRSSAIGLAAGLFVAAGALIWLRRPTQRTRRVLGGLVLAMLALGVLYVVSQARSEDRLRSGPVQLRLAYLFKSWELVRGCPFLGIGPDQFVIDMTNRMSPLRAESPHVYHGNFDPAAHNEWAQAAVELGIPGGLFYVAIPIGVLLVTLKNRREIDDLPTTLALMGGMAAICISEAASITLRGPIMPVWYWTLLGMLASAGRAKTLECAEKNPGDRRMRGARFSFAALGCFVLVLLDVGGSMSMLESDTRGHRPGFRFFAERRLDSQYRFAERALHFARTTDTKEDWTIALEHWNRLYPRAVGYLDTTPNCAEAIIQTGDGLRGTLVLAFCPDAFNFHANMLGAQRSTSPEASVRFIKNALRACAIGDIPAGLLRQLPDLEKDAELRQELVKAREAAARLDDDETLRGAVVDLLRLSAWQKEAAGDVGGAIADQRLAADCYRRLELESHPYRRAHGAETDAWFTLAKMIYEHRPDQWREAYGAVVQAERYAIMGIKHEEVSEPDPKLGYLGGEVVPTEFPERLRPLWRLSAQLHVIAGDDRLLDFRIWAGLPPGQWTGNDLSRERTRLARHAREYLSLPAPKGRPTPGMEGANQR